MEEIAGSPFTWLQFEEDGSLSKPAQVDAVQTIAKDVADLVVISHGWKNNQADARRLYEELWTNVVAVLGAQRAKTTGLVGVEWPAKAYKTDFDAAALRVAASGGTLSASPAATSPRRDLTQAELQAIIDDFTAFHGQPASAVALAATATIAGGGLDAGKAKPLFEESSTFIGRHAAVDEEIARDVAVLAAENPHERLLALANPPRFKVKKDVGAAQSLGSATAQVFAGPRAAIGRFLNQLTYFEMKNRAGIVGRRLGSDVLPKIDLADHVRVHLVGHSFGARLVTAATSALPQTLRPFSLSLLQGAFSHNALAGAIPPDGSQGAFANVVGRPVGPIVMTHTHNDEACTFWYAIASRLSRDTTKAIGDKDDPFGAMGANGAQHLKADDLAEDTTDQSFRPVREKVNRFLADAYVIKTDTVDAHNNVTNPTVGRLVASVLGMPRS